MSENKTMSDDGAAPVTLDLADPSLFVERAFVGGAWVVAASGRTVAVNGTCDRRRDRRGS